jgi:hypothetical protein
MRTKIDYDMNDTTGVHSYCARRRRSVMRTTWRHTFAKLPKDMMGCPDLLITSEAAVRDSYVVLKDSRSVLLVSHRTWSSVEKPSCVQLKISKPKL